MTGLQLTFQRVLLAAVPHGGQRVSRRNAWDGMSADAVTARARREAELALTRVPARPEHVAR